MEKIEKQSVNSGELGITRRDLLKKAGRGLLALGVVGLGVFDKESEAGENNSRRNKERLEKLKDLISGYIEQDSILSEKEIKECVECCGFVENINIQKLTTRNFWKPFTETDVLKDSIDRSLASGSVKLEESSLNIIQTDFNKIGALNYGAFFSNEYNSIFINQEGKEKRKERIENFIYKEAMLNEYRRLEDLISMSNISEEEKNSKRKDLREWLEIYMKDKKSLSEIKELVLRYLEPMEKSVKELSD